MTVGMSTAGRARAVDASAPTAAELPAPASNDQATSPATLASVATGGRITRTFWCAGGFLAVGVGGVGIALPGLPTTVFFIIAAWCFSHGSPRFEKWVLDLPAIGPMVRDHRLGLGMPKRIKVIANAMMWTAIAISGVILHSMPWVVAGLVALGTIGTVYIVFQVPTRETELARRAALAEAGL
ncbi:MAG: YbaN family protein [Aquihabitans sp.]